MTIQRSIRVGLVALAGTLALAALGLASWEPLVATVAPPPPARLYDTVIARDRFGVPHVFGRTDPDVAYGVGYAHAEDDFETLQKVFAMVRGRLGALTGSDGAKTDYVLHLLGARETVDRDYDGQPADVRALLDGYASGLNLYAARHPGEVRLAVWSQVLMVQQPRASGRKRYGSGSTRERHDDRGRPSSDTA